MDSKPWWQSKTIWGGIVTAVAAVLGIWGVAVSPEDQAQLVDTITLVAAGIGGVVAIIGRLAAKKQIGGKTSE